mgnify:CR=1 FL=1
MRIRELTEADIIDFAKATDPANVPIDRVNKMLQKIGIADYGVLINKPFDIKIFELLIDTYMNGVFPSSMENKILYNVIQHYQKRGVIANKLPADRPKPLPENKECGPGEYFCGKSQKCLPIPKGHKVRSDGYLIKEKRKLSDKPCPACGDPDCDHKEQHMTEMKTTDYVDEKQFGKHVQELGGSREVVIKMATALQFFQKKAEQFFYEIEQEKGGESVWQWKKDPKGYTQHPKMVQLRKFLQDNLQQSLNDGNVPIQIIHIDHAESMAPVFRLNLNTNEGTRCWKGYKKKGMKTMFGKRVPNCVKNESEEKFITHRELASIIYKYTKNLQLARDFDQMEDDFVSQDDMQSTGLSGMDQDPLEYDRERVNKILSMHNVPVKVVKMKQDDMFNTLYSILQTVATEDVIAEAVYRRSGRMYFTSRHADDQMKHRRIVPSKMDTALTRLEDNKDWLLYMRLHDLEHLLVYEPKSDITMALSYRRKPLDPTTREPMDISPGLNVPIDELPQAIEIRTVYHGSPKSSHIPKNLKRNKFIDKKYNREIDQSYTDDKKKRTFFHLDTGIQRG